MTGTLVDEPVLSEGPVRFRVPSLGAVVRHAWPQLFEGSLVPFALLTVGLWVTSVKAAVLVTFSWSVLALLRRLVLGRRVSAALILAVVILGARTAFLVATGDTLVYFLQPVLTSTLVGLAFFGSLLIGRPLVWRFAGDLLPLPAHLIGDPGIARLFRRLTVLWGGATLTGAAVHAWLYLSVPLTAFVLLRAAASTVLTGAAVGVSVWWARPHVEWPARPWLRRAR